MPKPTLLFVLSVAAAATGGAALETASRAAAQTRLPLVNVPEPAPRPAPSWKNTSWLNADRPQTLESLRGRVVLLNFWTFTCYNCRNAIPSLVTFDRTYRERGLTVIGIHTPEFPPYAGEHDRANVAKALKEQGIEYPNAQDNDSKTWDLYRIRYWPSYVLIDRRGEIRYEGYGEFHLGDAHHQLWDQRIRALLEEDEQ
ncbi:MAG: redoxin domain-containing protein [Gemmatimonadales bacterium]